MTDSPFLIPAPDGIFTAIRGKGGSAVIDTARLDKLEEFWKYAFNLERRGLARFEPSPARDRLQSSLAASLLCAVDCCNLPPGHDLEGAVNQVQRQISRLVSDDLQALGFDVQEDPEPAPSERLGDPEE